MNVVGRVTSFISQGVYSVATPFHPFGGAVDIIVVQQRDGTFRSTPWYVRFGKFQGVLKGAEKIVRVKVNGTEANFHMYLDNSAEAYFVREIDPDKDDSESFKDSENFEDGGEENSTFFSHTDNSKENEIFVEEDNYSSNVGIVGRNECATLRTGRIELVESDSQQNFAEFQDDHSSLESSGEFPEFYSSRYDNLESIENMLDSQDSNSGVILVSVDGQILTAPVVSSEGNPEEVQLNTPRFHLGPATKETGKYNRVEEVEEVEAADYLSKLDASTSCANKEIQCSQRHVHHAQETQNSDNEEKGVGVGSSPESRSIDFNRHNISRSCSWIQGLAEQSTNDDHEIKGSLVEALIVADEEDCSLSPVANKDNNLRNLEIPRNIDASAPDTNSDSSTRPEMLLHGELHQTAIESSTDDNSLMANRLLSEEKAEVKEEDSRVASTPSRAWRLWPIPFRRVKTIKYNGSISSSGELLADLDTASRDPSAVKTTNDTAFQDIGKQIVRTNVPTTGQIASLNLKDGQNMVTFVFSTNLLGSQKVEAHIYFWKWNTRIVISDVDGTITKSDVLGQVMPLVGRDWTHSGIARLFSAIKENGYQLLFLSARAIVQSYLTKNFLFNLKQDGKSLPSGPVFISPDGLFPSLYREVIRRAPHEFKIACLEDIKALFPPDYNPFYAGFGNRDTDELSYLKIGIPKGKIFIINPKGEVAINHRVDVKSYLSLHTLVNDMFPPTSLLEQEDYNSWNYWKLPLPNLDDL